MIWTIALLLQYDPGPVQLGPTSKKKTHFHSKNLPYKTLTKTFCVQLVRRPCSTMVGWDGLACGLVAVRVAAVQVGVVRVGVVRVSESVHRAQMCVVKTFSRQQRAETTAIQRKTSEIGKNKTKEGRERKKQNLEWSGAGVPGARGAWGSGVRCWGSRAGVRGKEVQSIKINKLNNHITNQPTDRPSNQPNTHTHHQPNPTQPNPTQPNPTQHNTTHNNVSLRVFECVIRKVFFEWTQKGLFECRIRKGFFVWK